MRSASEAALTWAKVSQGHLRDNSRLDVENSRMRMAVLST